MSRTRVALVALFVLTIPVLGLAACSPSHPAETDVHPATHSANAPRFRRYHHDIGSVARDLAAHEK